MTTTTLELKKTQLSPFAMSILFLSPLLLLGSLSIDLYIPYVPMIPQEFACSFTDTQLTLTIPMFMMGLSQIIWGRSIDKIGMIRSLYIALFCYLSGSLICWKTYNITLFLIGRSLQGVGACGANVFAICSARAATKEPQTSILLSRLMGIAGTAPIFAPFLGLALTHYMGTWRAVFFFLTLFTALIAFGFSLFYSNLIAAKSQQKESPIEEENGALMGDMLTIIQNREFKQFLMTPCLMLTGLLLFFAFSTHYLQDSVSVEPMYFRMILSGHAVVYVLSSFLLAPIVASSEVLIRLGVSALFALYASMYVISTLYPVPLSVFITMTYAMSIIYGALYGPSIQKTLRTIKKNAGLATALVGTLQFTTASLMATFAFPSHDITIAHYVAPLAVMSGFSLILMYIYQSSQKN